MSDMNGAPPIEDGLSHAEEAFVSQVEDVLAHLYDYPYLQTHPLADRLCREAGPSPRERMRLLRTTVLEAIAEMDPGPSVHPRSIQARVYNVLNLRYVAGMTVEAVAAELGISERQFYRDLRKATRQLAALLWSRHAGRGIRAESAADSAGELQRETERLGIAREEVSIQALLEASLASVSRLSQQLGVPVEAAPLPCPLSVWTDRMLARQALLSALSCAVQSAAPSTTVRVAARAQGPAVRVEIRYTGKPTAGNAEPPAAAAEQLVRRLGGHWQATTEPAGQTVLAMTLGDRRRANVLLVDDNQSLHELFRRYLPEEQYRLNIAGSGCEGLRLAQEMAPDVIVLDVMMPQEDGWEILQLLCNRERTRDIPVIVCSVLNDPQLALSLGAAAFLPKPVQRADLLLALSRCRQDIPPRSRPGSP